MFIINGTMIDNFKKKNPIIANIYNEEEIDNAKAKYTKTLALGISIILIGVIVMIALNTLNTFGENAMPVAFFMYLVTIGVTTIVYSGMMQEKYNVEGYNKQNTPEAQKEDNKIGKICGVIMLIAASIFLIWGFCFSGWQIGWIVFPIGGILCGIISTILKKDN